jgi:hypothetical protein
MLSATVEKKWFNPHRVPCDLTVRAHFEVEFGTANLVKAVDALVLSHEVFKHGTTLRLGISVHARKIGDAHDTHHVTFPQRPAIAVLSEIRNARLHAL